MNRAEFMKKLRTLLSDVEENEREEALEFYEHYFEDAGEDNEQEVIASLGSPEKVAQTIKDGLKDIDGMQGEFTENGYRGYGETIKEEVGYPKKSEKSGKKTGNGKMILLLILAIFALPVLGPIIMGIVSALLGILAAAVAIVFAVAVVGIALLVAGASIFAIAIGKLFFVPIAGVILLGTSLLLIGIGILAMVLGIWIVTKVVPLVIRLIVKCVSKLFKKKEEHSL